MITYDWNCRTVDAYPLEEGNTDVVYNIHYRVIGTSDQLNPEGIAYSASSIGTQTLTISSGSTFIPFEDLTNEIVTGWTQTAMGPTQVGGIEDTIANVIADKITPITVRLVVGE
tara:strand:- start:616 stop:957 length:342 start_codon:yes stop_codon:yes gene_type:complete